MFINLCLLYKISSQISKNRVINVVATIISVIPLCSCLSEGNYVEEYTLPFILCALYIFIKFIKNEGVKYREVFLCGICLGIIIFIKPNIISTWLAFIPLVILIYLKNKKYKELLKTILIFLGGLLTIIIPVIVYFALNNALSYFVYAFIEFNLKYAGYHDVNFKEACTYFLTTSKISIIIFGIMVANIAFSRCKKQKSIIQIMCLIYYFITIIIFSIGGRIANYYKIALIPCYIIPITEILEHINNVISKKLKIFLITVISILFLILIKTNLQTQINLVKKQLIPKDNAEIVNCVIENSEAQDNVLVLMNSCGYYNLTNRQYHGKYMYQIPLILIDDNIYNEFIREFEENRPKIIIYPNNYEDFKMNSYLVEDYMKIIEESNPHFLENKQNYESIYEKLSSITQKTKNVTKMLRKIQEMEKNGIYTKILTTPYLVWKLNENE